VGVAVTAHSMLKSLQLMMRALLRQSSLQCMPVSWHPTRRGDQHPLSRSSPWALGRYDSHGRLTPARARAPWQVVVFDQASKLAHCVAWVHMDQHASVEAAYRAGRAALGSLTGRLSAQRRRLPNGRARPAPRLKPCASDPGPLAGSPGGLRPHVRSWAVAPCPQCMRAAATIPLASSSAHTGGHVCLTACKRTPAAPAL